METKHTSFYWLEMKYVSWKLFKLPKTPLMIMNDIGIVTSELNSHPKPITKRFMGRYH